jgi:hypothetical protein
MPTSSNSSATCDSPDNGREISVTRLKGSEAKGYLRLRLTIKPLPKAPPIEGKVNFHLHPTFTPPAQTVEAKNGRATLEVWSLGAFTLGVEIVDEDRKFELDLATSPELPVWFRQR